MTLEQVRDLVLLMKEQGVHRLAVDSFMAELREVPPAVPLNDDKQPSEPVPRRVDEDPALYGGAGVPSFATYDFQSQ